MRPAPTTPLHRNPAYATLDYATAKHIVVTFPACFPDGIPDADDLTAEDRDVLHAYSLAVAWLVREDRWRDAGLDEDFVTDLLQTAEHDNLH